MSPPGFSGGPPPAVRTAIDHLRASRLKPAIDILRQHLRRHPHDHNSQFLLGNALSQDLQNEPAIYALEKAAHGLPSDPQRWVALGVALFRTRGAAAAEALLRDCPAVAGANPDAMTLLADTRATLLRAAEAVPILESVLAAHPGHSQAHKTLGKLQSTAGDTDRALEHFHRSIAHPDDYRAQAAYCFHTNYSGTLSPAQVFALHAQFHDTIQRLVPSSAAASNPRPQPTGPIRLGLFSPDFQQHSVAHFVEPIIEHLDPARFRIICISAGANADSVTARLRAKADEWVDASSQDPTQMSAAIRSANADILIDLAGLTGPARIVAFAQRLAPLQGTYCGYPNTSAVPNVDVRLVDADTDPPTPFADGTRADDLATERLARIEGCFLCYRPPDDAPPPTDRPSAAAIAFGSFNTSHKMSPQCVALWSRVLSRVPGSTLVLKRKEFEDPWIARQFIDRFASHGIARERLVFMGKTPSIAEHLSAYSAIDIALDTFPYHGTTTTCEALWMGVPVVSLAGTSHAARVGKSLLRAAGLPHLSADTPEAFVDTAAALAADHTQRAHLRRTLREQVRNSTLCDGPAFAARFGAALEQLAKHRPSERSVAR